MTISVRDLRRSATDRKWLESVYDDYLDDLAPLGTGMFPTLREFGHRASDQLTSWFTDSSAHLLTVPTTTAPVGFALVRMRQPTRRPRCRRIIRWRSSSSPAAGVVAASARRRCG